MVKCLKTLMILTAACLLGAAAAYAWAAASDGGPDSAREREQVAPEGGRAGGNVGEESNGNDPNRPPRGDEGAGPAAGPGGFGPFGGPGDFGPPPGMGGFGGRRGRGGFGPPGGPGARDMKLVDKFDKDGDGRLNDEERAAAREYVKAERGGMRGPGFFGQPQGTARRETTGSAPLLIPPKTSENAPDTDLYDQKTLRTIYLQFSDPDWFGELGDFYHTDVEVPADMIVDGVTYPSVGVRFRGNTSYMFAGNSDKKPFNISVDYADGNQRLRGYKTLNLHNGNGDPTILRDVLFSRISRTYTPSLKANFVKLVINGENWGIYSNVQQFNKDFLEDWYGTKKGLRWKISMMGPGGGSGALTWEGDDPEVYKQAYELKSKNDPETWAALIDLCKKLNDTPADRMEAELKPILNIDQVLWALAIGNVFIDEGYVTRGADYALYREGRYDRFCLLSVDNNETFKEAEGPGMGRRVEGVKLSPVAFEDDDARPLIHRLLAVPALRARYLAHVRTIVEESLDWEKLAPIVAEYHALIDAEVKADTKKLYSYEAFVKGPIEDVEGGGMPGGGPPMFGGGPGPGGGPPMAPPEAFLDDMFKRMDADGNGRIAGDEIPDMTRDRMLRDDADGDGTVTREEFGKSFLNGPPGAGFDARRGGDGDPDGRGQRAGRGRGFRGGRGGRGPGGPGGGNISLKRFVDERRAFLLADPEMKKPCPTVGEVTCSVPAKGEARTGEVSPLATESVRIQARVGGEAKADTVFLYYAEAREAPFQQVAMFDDGRHGDGESGDGVYVADVPPFPAGTHVHYYVEARAPVSVGTTAFFPPRAEFGALTYEVVAPVAGKSPVVINELMASNVSTIRDPQGDYDDWIELRNISDREVDLSGMYLSDKKDNPRKWRFPDGTTLAPGARLIVWADEDGKAEPGLHANFKLSKSGETVLLVDKDERGNALLDSVTFGKQADDAALGRSPDGNGDFKALSPTPRESNR